jgi:hypothetical protein
MLPMPSDIQPHSRTGTLLALSPGESYQDSRTLRVQITEVSAARRRLIALWSMASCRAAAANPRAAWSSKTYAAPVGPDQADVTITITRTQ